MNAYSCSMPVRARFAPISARPVRQVTVPVGRTTLAAAILALAGACQSPSRPPAAAPAPRADHVLIVSIDGLRPDAIDKAQAPTLQGLIRTGAYCPKAQTVRPPVTLTSHTAMLTGLDAPRHGVDWNDYRPGHIRHPTVFTEAKKAGRSTAMLFGKNKFHYLADPSVIDFVYGEPPQKKGGIDSSGAGLAKVFATEWLEKRFALTFVHIREPDLAGHGHGWMGPEYLDAVAVADRAVGSLVETLRQAGRLDQTAIIVTADHGGSGKNHGAVKPENTTIPWICVGPGVPAGLRIERMIYTYDTAPTALAFLGIPAPEGIDGKAVGEVAAVR